MVTNDGPPVFVRRKFQEIVYSFPFRCSGSRGNFINLGLENPPLIREEKQIVVGFGIEKMRQEIFFGTIGADEPLPSTPLGFECVRRKTLHVSSRGVCD